jgi:recombination protein RecA
MAKDKQAEQKQARIDLMDKFNTGLNKGNGKDSSPIMRAGDSKGIMDIKRIPSGSLLIDSILGYDSDGVGGFPIGRISEIYGPAGAGKSTLTLNVIKEAQKKDLDCLLIDSEQAFSLEYAKNLGIDTDLLAIQQESVAERAFETIEAAIDSGIFKVIVVDSVANLVPLDEISGEMEDKQMGSLARVLNKGLRKITAKTNDNNVTVIFINQIRDKIGGMGYGPTTDTVGGHALKFYTSVRLEVKRKGSIKKGEEEIGNVVIVKAAKNKTFPPFKKVDTEIYFGRGFLKEAEIVDMALKAKIIEKAGSWFSYGDDKLGQGKPKVIDKLIEEPALLQEIEDKLAEHLKEEQA